MNLDKTKEFAVVDAIEKQLAVKQRGEEAFRIVTCGCVILRAFVTLYPNLRRNCTCQVIHKLLVDVYDLFCPLPYYFPVAIDVLDALLKNEMNIIHYENRALFIYKCLIKHKNMSKQFDYEQLESILYNIIHK
jgi:hypothetical protein